MDQLDQDARAFMARVTTPPRHDPRRIAPALAEASRTDIETSSGRVATWRLGEGPAVILAHGWSTDNSTWDPLIRALASRGRAVVAVDHPGHGLSADAHCTRRSAGAALAQVAEALGPISAAAGHSFGGPVIGLALSQGMPAARVAFIAPAPARSKRWLRFAQEIGVAPEIAEHALVIAEREGEMFDMSVPGSHMGRPALFVQSKDDPVASYESTASLSAAWTGSEIMLVDGLGHESVLADEAVVERVAAFLA